MTAVEATRDVAPEYVHMAKVARPEPKLTLGDTVLKWYDIGPEEAPVPLVVRALARRNLRDAAKADELGLSGDLGFVILHRCGESFHFLIVCTWKNDNELWQTVWAKDGDAQPGFRPWVVEGTHRPTYCVWELGAVCHERQAWSEFLESPRSAADREAYLAASYDGYV